MEYPDNVMSDELAEIARMRAASGHGPRGTVAPPIRDGGGTQAGTPPPSQPDAGTSGVPAPASPSTKGFSYINLEDRFITANTGELVPMNEAHVAAFEKLCFQVMLDNQNERTLRLAQELGVEIKHVGEAPDGEAKMSGAVQEGEGDPALRADEKGKVPPKNM